MKTINLNTSWRLRPEDLSLDHRNHAAVAERKDGWYETALPCDVRMPLIEAGVISEPLEGLGCFASEWIEEKAWWFVRDFDFPEVVETKDPGPVRRVELVLDYLDYGAAIYLNGNFLGEHDSVFFPFRCDVGRFLVQGANRLTVRLSAGTDRVSGQRQGDFLYASTHEAKNGRPDRGDKRRVFLRKPQYSFGWDWGPRVATVGIADARLELSGPVEAGSLAVVTLSAGSRSASLQAGFEIENLDPLATAEAEWELVLTDLMGKIAFRVKRKIFLRSGINPVVETIGMVDPDLWWPNGWGEAILYTACVTVYSGSAAVSECIERFGIRTIELDQSPLPESGEGHRKFAFRVNGVEIFCKGANWIPADSIYERVDTDKYRALVAEAKAANFSMLRVWGGGLYEKDSFYAACDEAGILVWQDLMFGCAFYPDRDREFLALVEKEFVYQIRRLGKRPCMALWCGNNEIHWCRDTAWFDGKEPYFGGEELWNRMAPRLVALLSPSIPYWNSSPYGGAVPNGWEAGDRHHWREAMMHAAMEKRITPEDYDADLGKFVSEYGYIGPCSKRTIERYFAGEKVVVGSGIWNHHNNAFEKDTVAAGIAKHYVDPAGLPLDDYLLYAGLAQALMYGYSLESMRFRATTAGGLFWMFADCWGEVGWTIIDYYMERKIAFYAVCRAFAPVKLILRAADGRATCVGANDTAEDLVLQVEYGLLALDGSSRSTQKQEVVLPAHSRASVLEFTVPPYDPSCEAVFVAPLGVDGGVLPAVLRGACFRDLRTVDPSLEVRALDETAQGSRFTVSAKAWAHAVHFDLPRGVIADDEWFDLLPGETRTVCLSGPGLEAGKKIRLEASAVR